MHVWNLVSPLTREILLTFTTFTKARQIFYELFTWNSVNMNEFQWVETFANFD